MFVVNFYRLEDWKVAKYIKMLCLTALHNDDIRFYRR